ncbi:hypothetical protein BJ138DRAFT_1113823 [Hygrophoropsis aurantiaca]|uniref:Uncharacterized protein n=1 Tax=Hygrophoropsis aurantiaca TaxID=72124 RepID=A0ACB8AD34_9AGAM|nr:hypothetical protein BJ138DRAFT_1113823 [Hygrophoropsis aurantiaca]
MDSSALAKLLSFPTQLEALDLSDDHSISHSSFTLSFHASIEYEQPDDIRYRLPSAKVSMITSHPVEDEKDLRLIRRMQSIFQDDLLVRVRERWYLDCWNKIDIPSSIQKCRQHCAIEQDSFCLPNPIPSTPLHHSTCFIPSPVSSSTMHDDQWDVETISGMSQWTGYTGSPYDHSRSSLHSLSDVSANSSPAALPHQDLDVIHPLLSENITIRSGSSARRGLVAPTHDSNQLSPSLTQSPTIAHRPEVAMAPVTSSPEAPTKRYDTSRTAHVHVTGNTVSPLLQKLPASNNISPSLPTSSSAASSVDRTKVKKKKHASVTETADQAVLDSATSSLVSPPLKGSAPPSRVAPRTPLLSEVMPSWQRARRQRDNSVSDNSASYPAAETRPETQPPNRQLSGSSSTSRPEISPVQIKSTMHAHEGAVSVTNHIYLMTANSGPPTELSSNTPAGQYILQALKGLELHHTTWGEISRCVQGYYERSGWTAILFKCGIPEDRMQNLLGAMLAARHEIGC